MKTITLGKTDLQVTSFCLGTMTFGEQVDEAAAHAILDRSLERGVNFIDTAGFIRYRRARRPTAPPRPSSATGLPSARRRGKSWFSRPRSRGRPVA